MHIDIGRKNEEAGYKMKVNEDEYRSIAKCNKEKDLGIIIDKFLFWCPYSKLYEQGKYLSIYRNGGGGDHVSVITVYFYTMNTCNLCVIFMFQEVQKHSVHTLVFRSLKRTHDMFLSDQGTLPLRDEKRLEKHIYWRIEQNRQICRTVNV